MLDFAPVRGGQMTLAELTRGLMVADLRRLTVEMVGTMLGIVATAADADVVFVPVDPKASDEFSNPAEAAMAWTLGHVIVHTTASAEEAAAVASSLARGVPVEGRSRYETDWRTITTAKQLRQRLEESQRMRLAFLNVWPDPPHLEVTNTFAAGDSPRNAVALFVSGLMHDDDHLAQLEDIRSQARAARRARAGRLARVFRRR